MRKILFLGYGYVAQYFCASFEKEDFELAVTINSSAKAKYFESGLELQQYPFSKLDSKLLDGFDHFVISIPPYYQLKTDEVLKQFYAYFLGRKLPYKLIYLSATSVYGDHAGAYVSEESELKAASENGLARIACEQKYLDLCSNKSANIMILRLAGIYGPWRNNILAIKEGRITHNKATNRVISRIHVADIVRIIKKLVLSSEINNQIFNLADDEPCPTNQVNDYICEQLLDIPKLPIDSKTPEFRHSSFALDNKIVSNQKLKDILKHQFSFTSYKDGLQEN